MEMIQNAMLQDVAPAVLLQPGSGAAAAGAADGGSSFANLLQGRQLSRAEAAQAADPQGGPATRGGSQSSAFGTPELATGGAAALNLAVMNLQRSSRSDEALQSLEQTVGQQESTLAAGLTQPASTPAKAKVSDQEESALSVPDSPAPDPQAVIAAAQQGLAAILVASAREASVGTPKDTSAIGAPVEQAGMEPAQVGVISTTAPATVGALQQECAAGGAQPAARTQSNQGLPLTAEKGTPLAAAQKGAPVQQTAQASRQLETQQKVSDAAQQVDAGSGRPSETVKVVTQGAGLDARALDAQRAAASGMHAEVLPQAEAASVAVQPAATGTPEKEPRLEAASSRQAEVQPQAVNPQQEGAQSSAQVVATPEATPFSERMASQKAEVKAARREGLHGTYSELRGVGERSGTTPAVSVEDTGSTVSTIQVARSATSQGFLGQNGSGDAEQKGHPEQKAQTSDGADQLQGLGLKTGAASEAQPVEAKPAHAKTALHESILSQVRDGVVTHDGKGNGQMSIRLNPGELGELKIQVRMEDNRLKVEVQADNKMVKDLLLSNLDSLKESLTSKNFTMEGFDVSTGGGFNSPLNEQQGNPQQQSFRTARAAGYGGQAEETRVNYLTEEVNGLLDVSF